MGSLLVKIGLLAALVLPAASALAQSSPPEPTKIIIVEATYVMGDADTLAGAEEAVLMRAKRTAVEEAGVYVEAASTDVETHANGETSHLNQLSVRTISSAVTETEFLEKRQALENGRLTFYVKIRCTVHVDMLADAVKRMKSDELLAQHHHQLQTENSQLKNQLAHLKSELQSTGTPANPLRSIPKNRREAVRLGRAAFQSHSLPEKIDLATQAMAADDRYVDAYVIRGQTYLRIAAVTFSKEGSKADLNGYIEQASQDFDHAVALDPASTWAILGRGDVMTWQRKMDEAAKEYARVLQLDPYFDVARQRLMSLLTTTARRQVAAKQWRQALDTLDQVLQPDLPLSWMAYQKEALLLRSQVYTELGELDRAVEDLGKVIRIDPTNAMLFVQRAQLYRRQLLGRLAKDDLERACALGAEEGCSGLR
ncbi:MAG: tetratricopeptide repeat protein [Nitrospiraceae bacterium]